jgi:hypothetical protein
MPKLLRLTAVLILAGALPALNGQDPKADLQKRLASEFVLTQPTKDKSDIVTSGSLLVLQKGNLLLYGTSNPIPPQSTYKKGKITRNPFGGRNFLQDLGNSMVVPGQSAAIVQRTFVAGEKLWATKIDVKDDGVVFALYSDPVGDIRYFGELKFPFPKGQPPPADNLMNTIAEVVTVEPPDTSATATQTPPASTKTIALGQTKDQVVALFGQPQKMATVGAKDIYAYPDMKVTFVDGKVADVN